MGWLRGSGRALLAIAACYSLQDVRNEGCKTYCISRGYQGGTAVGKKLDRCACVDFEDYDTANGKPLSLGVPGAALGGDADTSKPKSSYPYIFHPSSSDDN